MNTIRNVRIRRFLRWYERGPGDALAGETELHGMGHTDLRSVLGEPIDESAYSCYAINDLHVDALWRLTDISIDPALFDYCIECHAVEEDS